MLTVVPGTISRGVREISSYENEKPSSEAPLIDFPLISHWPEWGHMSMPKPITDKRNGTFMIGLNQSGPNL